MNARYVYPILGLIFGTIIGIAVGLALHLALDLELLEIAAFVVTGLGLGLSAGVLIDGFRELGTHSR
jgi:hypothetical protein